MCRSASKVCKRNITATLPIHLTGLQRSQLLLRLNRALRGVAHHATAPLFASALVFLPAVCASVCPAETAAWKVASKASFENRRAKYHRYPVVVVERCLFTAKLISRFIADLQPDRRTEKMAAASSLLPTQGLLRGDVKHTTQHNAPARTRCSLFELNICIRLHVRIHVVQALKAECYFLFCVPT